MLQLYKYRKITIYQEFVLIASTDSYTNTEKKQLPNGLSPWWPLLLESPDKAFNCVYS